MGQRHQYLIVMPAVDYGPGNPNNRPQWVQVIHHQWLYGAEAIKALDRVTRFIASALRGAVGGSLHYNAVLSDIVPAIGAAISLDVDTGYFYGVHIYRDADEPADFYGLDRLDNNDGVTVVCLNPDEPKPLVCFSTPGRIEGEFWPRRVPEGGEPCAYQPLEYLRFYQMSDEPETQEALARVAENSRPMSTAILQGLLPHLRHSRPPIAR